MKFTRHTMLAAVLVVISGVAQAAPFSNSAPSTPNIDPPPGNPRLVTIQSSAAGDVTDLAVRIAMDSFGNNGTYWDNVRVTLTHQGVTVVLMDIQQDNAGSDSTLIADFQDGGADLAASLVQGGVTQGVFAPEDPLSSFYGLPAAGPWVLSFEDYGAYPNDGTRLRAAVISGNRAGFGPAAPVPTFGPAGLVLMSLLMLLIGGVVVRRQLG